jgi:ABC-type transport system substrate-binding protein/serine/threonine protein kinase
MPEIAPLREGDPRTLGPYRLVGLVGEGGQGSVFLGEHAPEDDGAEDGAAADHGAEERARGVAVKLLHARLSGDAKARARFADELRVAQRVAAFCTARVLDSDVEGDRPYIVSEYIDGPPLSEVLSAGGPRSGADLDRLAIGTMTALAAIHQAGVVHRDFKPHNVLMAPDGPRVIDFGIARALDATGTLSSTAVGTPAYMAPEQISGGAIGPATDIFAWGATMVYAATGRPAFGQDSIPAVMHRILSLPPDLGTLAEPLRGLVQACLNKEPSYRPSSQQVLVHLLSLAGSLPLPSDGAAEPETPDTRSTAVLSQGVAAASTHATSRLAATPVAYPQPNAWAPPSPFPQPVPPQQPPQWGQPGTWPGGTVPADAPPTGPGRRRRRGIGVLAGAGGATLVALVLAGTVTAVRLLQDDDSPGGGRTVGRTGGALQMSLEPATTNGLAPGDAGYGTERVVAKQLFTGLVEMSTSGTVRNRLASKITPNADCSSWRIDVRGGTTFSDGEPVDARAFVRGWVRAAQQTTGLAALVIGDVKGYGEAAKGDAISGLRPSGTGFDVDLISPDCAFDLRLADPMLAPVPASAGKHDNAAYNQQPIGNGPFKIESYQKDRRITLARNDAWAFGKAKLDRVVIELGPEASRRGRTGFQGGQHGWASLTSDDVAAARGDLALVHQPSMALNYLIPLTARGPMKSKDARLAVSYALDRQALSSALYGGVHPVAHGIVSPAIPGFGKRGVCSSCDQHDAGTARRYAEAAGLGPGTKINLHVRQLPSYRRWAEVVKSQLERTLGWSVEMKVSADLDLRKWSRTLTSDDASGLATFAWRPDVPTAFSMLRPLLSGDLVADADNDRMNYSGWKDARFDHLIWEAPRTTDAAGMRQRLLEAEKRALDDMALIPLVHPASAALRSSKFTGLGMDFEGDPTLATAAYK